MDRTKIKIAIVTQSLANGGAERFASLLSKMLVRLGFHVHIVSILDDIEYEYEGELFNLGLLKNKDNSNFGRLKRFFVFKKYIKQQDFDWIIDNRVRTASFSELMISKFIYNPKKAIYLIHSYKIEKYFPKNPLFSKTIYKESPYLVAVSKEIEALVQTQFHYKNTITIYNPIDQKDLIEKASEATISEKFILSYGRIDDDIKNYSLLIESYAQSILPQSNILLYIMGDGKDVNRLKRQVEQMHLSDKIIFKSKLPNPFPYVQSAFFTTLTSRNEGFPMTIIESLALGTPVVSVDCHSGPREIIRHEHNGLLVENHNPIALSQAMNRLVQDEVLYQSLKANASTSVAHLSLSSVAKEWQQLLTF
ncbi:glycosyltransferase [Flavobacterium sp.]|uniref:glycosyltransferase n=1 Tax=Flavobacterium sp. TaxID=239 RepID=UPI00286A430F|nr:glycosyltransferase [Flavobacterium sp.]